MRDLVGWLATAACVASGACEHRPGAAPGSIEETHQALGGSQAAGSIPDPLPARLSVGLFEDTYNTWMRDSGVPWDVRYRYFVKGWVNNWGWGSYDGGWGLGFLEECDAQGFVPAVAYYQIHGEDGGGESQLLSKVQNASLMRSYFGDFEILMQRAREFGKPVVVLVEADATGFLQQQTGGDPHAYAAVADTGMPALSSLPNTVAGWGQAFLALRESVGADNVVLGLHVSAWATGRDLAYFDVSAPLADEVQKTYDFLEPFGLSANSTGATYDVLVGDPLDRDSDYYRLVIGQDRWWDPSDDAPVSSKSFNRYAAWLSEWNRISHKRWVLWQMPLGNSAHKNVWNNGGPAEGYQDNRAEYFFGPDGASHREKFADAGVIALLFGAGAAGQSSYRTDVYHDGQLFMKSRAGAFLSAGGLPLARDPGGASEEDAGTPEEDAGTPEEDAGTPEEDAGTPSETDGGSGEVDTVTYDFESDAEGWEFTGSGIRSLSSSRARAVSGQSSLRARFDGRGQGRHTLYVSMPPTPAGAEITVHVWIPAGSSITSLQPYALQGAAGGWGWAGNWTPIEALEEGAWNALTVQVPADAATPLWELGVEISTSRAFRGDVFLDAVGW